MATPSLISYHQFGFKKVGSNCKENTGESTKPRGLHGISYGVFDRENIFTFILRRWCEHHILSEIKKKKKQNKKRESWPILE